MTVCKLTFGSFGEKMAMPGKVLNVKSDEF
jgi:hypothetical protein